MSKRYAIAFEVASQMGMFAAPDTGSEPSSSPLPPASAALGIIDSICWLRGVKVTIVAVATCGMPSWTNFSFNSHSPIRKQDTIRDDAACQIRATVLEAPRFHILAVAEDHDPGSLSDRHRNNNRAHYFQDHFYRRVKKGQSYHQPCMGWKELVLTYCGPQVTPVEQRYNTVLPAMLFSTFDARGNVAPTTITNVRIENGVVRYAKEPVTLRDGILVFEDEKLQSQVERCWTRSRYKNRQRAS